LALTWDDTQKYFDANIDYEDIWKKLSIDERNIFGSKSNMQAYLDDAAEKAFLAFGDSKSSLK
jgi:hypothetical protein